MKNASISRRSLFAGAGLFALSLSAWATTSLFAQSSKGHVVHIIDADNIQYDLLLEEAQRFVIESSLGSNTVEIADGRVRVVEASCPGKDCVHQAAVSSPGQSIVCLPNHLVIRIEEGDGNDEPDFKRYDSDSSQGGSQGGAYSGQDEPDPKRPVVDGISG